MSVTDVNRLYDFLLQQLAAESYIEDEGKFSTPEYLKDQLRMGTNRLGYRSGPKDLNEGWPGYTRMTNAQIDEFLQKFKVVHQWSDDPTHAGHQHTHIYDDKGIEIFANTGFSATLLFNTQTGEYTLSIRSTESREWGDGNSSPDGTSVGGGDAPRDMSAADKYGVVAVGFALAQLDALEQYFDWLKRSGNLPPGAVLNVTGYSLGGHLATVFTEMHQDDGTRLGETVTFNGAGRGNWDVDQGSLKDAVDYYHQVLIDPTKGVLEAVVQSEAAKILGGVSAPLGPLGSVLNAALDPVRCLEELAVGAAGDSFDPIYVYDDPRYLWAVLCTKLKFGLWPQPLPSDDNVSGNVTEVIGFETINNVNITANSQHHGQTVKVGIESQPLLADSTANGQDDYDYGNAHSITLIGDSLALQRAMLKLDDSFTLDWFLPILEGASNRKPKSWNGPSANYEADALENILDGLRRMILGGSVKKTGFMEGSAGFGDWDSRNGYFDNLNALTDSDVFADLAGKVRLEASGSWLVDRARQEFSALQALVTLSPVALVATSGNEGAVEAALSTHWQQEYSGWQEDHCLPTPVNYTDAWIEARGSLLSWLTWSNTQNIDSNEHGVRVLNDIGAIPDAWRFVDQAQHLELSLMPGRNQSHFIYFGDENDNSQSGGIGGDQLFGGKGGDFLEGRGGGDYIEGGEGGDILSGGKGNDTLLGGRGVDTYWWNRGDGYDAIVELNEEGNTEGGRLRLNGQIVSVVHKDKTTPLYTGGGYYFSDIGGSTLRVYDSAGNLVISVANFDRESNNLGIRFDDQVDDSTPPAFPPEFQPRPRDPVVVDLDGDGLETVGLAAGILFDHGNDGIAENSGWVGEDDALLVRDLNGDGLINNGAELFGNFTVLKNGQTAADGFAALADLDSNGDGLITADDTVAVSQVVGSDLNQDGVIGPDETNPVTGQQLVFDELRLWRDRNQNGQTDAGELLTLQEAGFSAFSLSGNYASLTQADGNIRRGTSVAFKADGHQVQTGIYDFLSSPILREFTDAVPIPPELQGLPDMGATGSVRDMREAAALSPAFAAQLAQFAAGDFATQNALLDDLVLGWAITSDQVLANQVSRDHPIVEVVWGASPGEGLAPDAPLANLTLSDGRQITAPLYWTDAAFTPDQQELQRAFRAIEYFSGQSVRDWRGNVFTVVAADNLPPGVSLPEGGVTVAFVGLTADGMATVRNYWDSLRQSVYESLVLQTRLAPLVQQVQWSTAADGQLQADFSALDATLGSLFQSQFNADTLANVVELFRFRGQLWEHLGWNGEAIVRQWVQEARAGGVEVTDGGNAPDAAALAACLAALGLEGPGIVPGDALQVLALGGEGNDSLAGTARVDQLLGGAGDDQLDGKEGNDLLKGGDGNDVLRGGLGDDVLVGGQGDDALYGGSGADIYQYATGDGHDTIHAASDLEALSMLEFQADIAPADVTLRRDGDDLFATLADGGQVRVERYFDGNAVTLQFRTDLTQWDLETVKTAVLASTDGDDTLVGYAERDDFLAGGAGNDHLLGSAGNDVLQGDDGMDLLEGGYGNDRLEGGAGNDYLLGERGDDLLQGGDGNDVLEGGDGEDVLEGGAGSDELWADAGHDVLRGGDGDDFLYGSGTSRLEGGAGNDSLWTGGADGVTWRRGDGQDRIFLTPDATLEMTDVASTEVEVWREGNNDLRLVVPGAAGSVSLLSPDHGLTTPQFLFADGVSWSVSDLLARAPVTEGSDAVRFVGGQLSGLQLLGGDDIATGSDEDDVADGNDGNDVLYGGGGNDTLSGGAGADLLFGDAGNDLLIGDAADALDGGDGDDVLRGGSELKGGNGNDRLESADADAILDGGAGDDALYSGAGNDQLDGGAGNDWLEGGAGDDSLTGGNGSNVLYGGDGHDVLQGGDDHDYLEGDRGDDALFGGNGDDVLWGGEGDDVLEGGIGNDAVYGEGGQDVLIGGSGDDTYRADVGDSTTILDVDGGGRINWLEYDPIANLHSFDIFLGEGLGRNAYRPDELEHLSSGVSVRYDLGTRSLTLTGEDGQTRLVMGGLGPQDALDPRACLDFTLDFGGDVVDANGQIIRNEVYSLRDLLAQSSVSMQGTGGDDVLYSLSDAGVRSLPATLIAAGDGNDQVHGGVGNDWLLGEGGDDIVSGGDGEDHLDGGSGSDSLYGDAGNDMLLGGEAGDYLYGGSGDDRLEGGTGDDVLAGGAGNDTYDVDSGGDQIVEDVGDAGIDTVISTATFILSDAVENLQLVDRYADLGEAAAIDGVGNGGENRMQGNAADNALSGLDGNDLIDGGGGNDTLLGGRGDDHLLGGADAVQWSLDYEHQIAQVVAVAPNADWLDGGDGNDLLDGGSGDDTLLGGDGDDQLYGGNDPAPLEYIYGGEVAFLVDGQPPITDNDVLDGGAGNDQLFGGSGDDQLLGGSGNDSLFGGEGNDLLDGRDNGQIDILVGGQGDDVYFIDGSAVVAVAGIVEGGIDTAYLQNLSAVARPGAVISDALADDVIEAADGGYDIIYSTVAIARPDNVEELHVVGGASASAFITGTAAADTLVGDAADNVIDGRVGADQMAGGDGNDTYVVDDAADAVIELAGGGNDAVYTLVEDYHLPDNVEYLYLGTFDGLGDDSVAGGVSSGYGNDGDNRIRGNCYDNTIAGGAGNDLLSGGGGFDVLDGGSGDDRYVFSIVEGNSYATIFDDAGVDRLHIAGGTLVGDLTFLLYDGGCLEIDLDPQASSVIWLDGWRLLNTTVDVLTLGDDETTYSLADLMALAPVAKDDQAALSTAQVSLSGSVLANDHDPQDGALRILNPAEFAGQWGTLSLAGDGSYTYSLYNGGADAPVLAPGETLVETFWAVVAGAGSDGAPGSSPRIYGESQLTITIGAASQSTFYGTAGDDAIAGGDASDIIRAGAGNDVVTGGGGDDTLYGEADDDSLAGGSGADTLIGGDGNDWLYDNSADVGSAFNDGAEDLLDGGAGSDTLVAAGNSNTLLGGTGDDTLQVTGSGNLLDGGDGNDTLVASGSAGSGNTLRGGTGDDTFVIDDSADAVVEFAAEGYDTVRSSVSIALADNVEALVLTGFDDLHGAGNGLANTLHGNSGDNTLAGGAGDDLLDGGLGADTLAGGGGNDTYYVDNVGDMVVETSRSASQIDTVYASVSYGLSNCVEKLVLTGLALNGTGSTQKNVITGNGLDNVLDGGLGADTLVGGAGNDSYYVDNSGDVVTENAGEGTDTVYASVSYALGASTSRGLENLVLTGTGNVNGAGNALDNGITGNSGNNMLKGNAGNDTLTGGAGNDVLNGGAGNDTYVFARGDGADILSDSDATAANVDVLSLGANIALDQLWLAHVGTGLEISVIGSSDKVTVSNWYGGASHHVEKIQLADGHYLLDTRVEQLVSAMAGMAPPPVGQTTLSATEHQQLDAMLAASWEVA